MKPAKLLPVLMLVLASSGLAQSSPNPNEKPVVFPQQESKPDKSRLRDLKGALASYRQFLAAETLQRAQGIGQRVPSGSRRFPLSPPAARRKAARSASRCRTCRSRSSACGSAAI